MSRPYYEYRSPFVSLLEILILYDEYYYYCMEKYDVEFVNEIFGQPGFNFIYVHDFKKLTAIRSTCPISEIIIVNLIYLIAFFMFGV